MNARLTNYGKRSGGKGQIEKETKANATEYTECTKRTHSFYVACLNLKVERSWLHQGWNDKINLPGSNGYLTDTQFASVAYYQSNSERFYPSLMQPHSSVFIVGYVLHFATCFGICCHQAWNMPTQILNFTDHLIFLRWDIPVVYFQWLIEVRYINNLREHSYMFRLTWSHLQALT
jgi:hypothetical protein